MCRVAASRSSSFLSGEKDGSARTDAPRGNRRVQTANKKELRSV